jgi:aldehyde dehydrogenase (NAD+)
MVLKPSEIAPLQRASFAEVLDAAGVPAGVFNLVNGRRPDGGQRDLAHPGRRHGVLHRLHARRHRRGAQRGPTVKRVCQELGGKSPTSCSMMRTWPGMSCPRRAGLLDGQFRPVLQRADAHAGAGNRAWTRPCVAREGGGRGQPSAIPGGDVAMGPVVSKAQFDSIQGYIQQGHRGRRHAGRRWHRRPEGCDKGTSSSPRFRQCRATTWSIAREEIFGPVLVIIPYADEADAIRIANDSQYGLSGYVVSKDIERARKRRAATAHRPGATERRRHDFSAPFGGYKHSGNGREFGVFGIEEYLEAKSICGYFSSSG